MYKRQGYQQGRAAFPKGPEPQFARRVYRYVHSGEDLRAAVAAWQARQRRAAPPSLEEFRGVVRPAPYRVEEKAAELLSLLRAEGPRRLTDLIRRSGSRSEAVSYTHLIPVILGVNGTDETMAACFRLLGQLAPGAALELLPYHRLGEEKYRQLGRPVPSPAFGIPSQDQLDHWRAMAQAMGRRVVSYR